MMPKKKRARFELIFPRKWVRKKLKLIKVSDVSDVSDTSSDISSLSEISEPEGYRSEEY